MDISSPNLTAVLWVCVCASLLAFGKIEYCNKIFISSPFHSLFIPIPIDIEVSLIAGARGVREIG